MLEAGACQAKERVTIEGGVLSTALKYYGPFPGREGPCEGRGHGLSAVRGAVFVVLYALVYVGALPEFLASDNVGRAL